MLRASSRVVRSAAALSFEHAPVELVGREGVVRDLSRAFAPFVRAGVARHAFVTGPVGAGKTLVARRFARELQRAAKDAGVTLEAVEVNCRRRPTTRDVLLRILCHFDPGFPDRGFSPSEMLDILDRRLERRNARLLVILDEADSVLAEDGSDLLYVLTRFDAERAQAGTARVATLLVATRPVHALMDEASRSTFGRANEIRVQPYSRAELHAIAHARALEAFHPGAITPDALDAIATASAASGDARAVLEYLQRAAALADAAQSPIILLAHAERAVNPANAPEPRGRSGRYRPRGETGERALALLAAQPGLTAYEIADRLTVSRMDMQRFLTKLLDARRIERRSPPGRTKPYHYHLAGTAPHETVDLPPPVSAAPPKRARPRETRACRRGCGFTRDWPAAVGRHEASCGFGEPATERRSVE